MYEFVSGPLVWISFIVFIGGSLYRLVSMHKLAKKEKVIYPYMSLKYGLRSIIHWIIPFASTNMRRRPLMTIITFAFHICLVLTPIFLLSHNLLWRQSWKISWRTLSGRDGGYNDCNRHPCRNLFPCQKISTFRGEVRYLSI